MQLFLWTCKHYKFIIPGDNQNTALHKLEKYLVDKPNLPKVTEWQNDQILGKVGDEIFTLSDLGLGNEEKDAALRVAHDALSAAIPHADKIRDITVPAYRQAHQALFGV